MRRHREGAHCGAFGATGSGKSYGISALIDYALTSDAVDHVFTLDDKGREPQYRGAIATTPTQLLSLLDANNPVIPAHVVFRGDLRNRVVCSAEEVAGFGYDLVRLGDFRVVVNIDELARAATPAGREWSAPTVRLGFNLGRALGLMMLWTTQLPQRVPPEALDQCTTLMLFRLSGRALAYLADVLDLPPELVALLPRLQRGEFALWQAGQPWDHCIYMF